MSRWHWYRGHGLLFRSEVELHELAPVGAGTADAFIRLGQEAGDAFAATDLDGPDFAGFRQSPLGPVMRIENHADVLVRDGREIIITPHPEMDPGMLRLFLIGSAMGMLCHQRGLLVLHGAATVHHRGVTIFVGVSGAGKSTLAAHLGRMGHAVLSDDTLALHHGPDGGFVAWPGSRVFKLWRDALDRLGEATTTSEAVANRIDKFYFENEAIAPDEPVPLDEIVVLERGGEKPVLERLDPLATMQILSEHAYRPEYVGLLDRDTPHFYDTAALMGSVRAYRLSRPWDASRIDETIGLMQRHWAALPPRDEDAG